jgi:hypothetical protein
MDQTSKLDRADFALNVSWLAVDACWMLGWYHAGCIFILPTLLFAILTFAYTERAIDPMCVTSAMAAWAVMTCGWFIGEIGWWRPGLPIAHVALAIAVVAILIVYGRKKAAREAAAAALQRFKRLRLRRE